MLRAATSAGWRGGAPSGPRCRCSLAAAPLAGAAYGVWDGLDVAARPRRSRPRPWPCSAAIAAGLAVYAAAVWALRVPEARQIRRLLVSRGRSGG